MKAANVRKELKSMADPRQSSDIASVLQDRPWAVPEKVTSSSASWCPS